MEALDITKRLAACAKVCEGIATADLLALPSGAFAPFAVKAKRFDLTKRQAEVLAFIKTYKAEHDGVSPSVREIMAGIGSNSLGHVVKTLDRLEFRGHIIRAPHHARSITIIDKED